MFDSIPNRHDEQKNSPLHSLQDLKTSSELYNKLVDIRAIKDIKTMDRKIGELTNHSIELVSINTCKKQEKPHVITDINPKIEACYKHQINQTVKISVDEFEKLENNTKVHTTIEQALIDDDEISKQLELETSKISAQNETKPVQQPQNFFDMKNIPNKQVSIFEPRNEINVNINLKNTNQISNYDKVKKEYIRNMVQKMIKAQ